VREYTLTSPALVYPSANEVTDFGAAQTELEIRVRQLSPIIGPGAPLQIVVPVA